MRSPYTARSGGVFERDLADRLSAYAGQSDQPFDALAIAHLAAASPPRLLPWAGRVRLFGPSLRLMWSALLLLALLAALIAGVVVVLDRVLPVPLPARFGPDELIVTRFSDPPDFTVTTSALNARTGEERFVADGFVLAVSPDRTQVIRHTSDGPIIGSADGREIAELPSDLQIASWSPDGRTLLLLRKPTAPPGVPVPASYVLWDTASGTSKTVPFTPAIYNPRPHLHFLDGGWSGDAQHVLLSTTEGLVVSGLDGSLVSRIPGTDDRSRGYWSPDGGTIAHEREGTLSILSVGPGFTTEVVETVTSATFPVWSPDGLHLAFLGEGGLTVLDLDHVGAPRVLFRAAPMMRDFVRWSQDGSELAFITVTTLVAGPNWIGSSWSLKVVDAAGGTPREIRSFSAPMGYSIPWISLADW